MTLQQSADREEVAHVVLLERSGRDRARWKQMHDQFHEQSTVSLSWFTGSGPEFVAASERMHAAGDHPLHRLGPPVVRLHGDRALVEISATIGMSVEVDNTAAFLASDARLNYRLVRADGVWGVFSIDAIYERDTLTPSVPGESIQVEAESLRGLRPSYALLALVLSKRGYAVRNDLLGDDLPDDVQRFYDDGDQWLGAPAA